jgi:hypothetical protein
MKNDPFFASLSAALVLGSYITCAAQNPSPVTVLRDVTVVDTRTGSLAAHRSIMIMEGKIARITGSNDAIPAGARVIRASGQYVVPGFSDMHIHLTELAAHSAIPLELLIANGVTLAREETTIPEIKVRAAELNSQANGGQLVAPEIVFQGVEAHLPPATAAEAASLNGMPSMDHLGAGLGLVLDCSTESDAIRADILAHGYKPVLPPSRAYILNPRAFDGTQNAPFYQRVLDTYSPERCKALAKTFASHSTWQTVTLIRLKTQDWGDDPRWTQNPELKYVMPQIRQEWQKVGEQYATLSSSAVASLQRYYELQLKVTKLMAANGVKILTGSDVGGVWLVPGYSLHDEFHELAVAGLSPLEILQATTLNAATFLHREESDGSVEAGKNANLVLLDGNPVTDSTNLDKIAAVIFRGRYMSRQEMQQLLSQGFAGSQ